MQSVRSPFDGGPSTTVRTYPDGSKEYIVRIRALTPFRKKLADTTRWGVGGVAALASCLPLVASHEPSLWFWAIPLPAFFIGTMMGHYLIQRLLRKKTVVHITKDRFAFSTFLGWRRFDREAPHALTLIPHDDAEDEQERHSMAVQQARMNGVVLRKAKYYGDSYHLCFDYIGQRHDIATIFGRKKAVACLTRLKAIDETVDGGARTGNGTALTPTDQWSRQPGGLFGTPQQGSKNRWRR